MGPVLSLVLSGEGVPCPLQNRRTQDKIGGPTVLLPFPSPHPTSTSQNRIGVPPPISPSPLRPCTFSNCLVLSHNDLHYGRPQHDLLSMLNILRHRMRSVMYINESNESNNIPIRYQVKIKVHCMLFT